MDIRLKAGLSATIIFLVYSFMVPVGQINIFFGLLHKIVIFYGFSSIMVRSKIFERLLVPINSGLAITKKIYQLFQSESQIKPRTNLSFYDPFLHRDLPEENIKTYSSEEAFQIVWQVFEESDMFQIILKNLQEIVPTFTKDDYKNASQLIHISNVPNTIYVEQGSRAIHLAQCAFPPPFRPVFLYLRMSTDSNLRNQQKKDIYKYYEFFLKETKQINQRDITENDIADFISNVETFLDLYKTSTRPAVQTVEASTSTRPAVQTVEASNSTRPAVQTVEAMPPNQFIGGSGGGSGGGGGGFILLVLFIGFIGIQRYFFPKPKAQQQKKLNNMSSSDDEDIFTFR